LVANIEACVGLVEDWYRYRQLSDAYPSNQIVIPRGWLKSLVERKPDEILLEVLYEVSFLF